MRQEALLSQTLNRTGGGGGEAHTDEVQYLTHL